ncbi:hypothetical protein H9Q72_009344 [Fusarium xylarioides]|uniref:Uncharacterized protein n=1 Tax=Fusarium xylarioides TaxID=221167 RepID=A0A9P7KYY2_9HYPO|nr:hypothetical protein H9Q70_006136 [Fusarium xylarioides]KAG5762562.1 hypothetical protein H9Q72_009344 [Fusarium xylarioides]
MSCSAPESLLNTVSRCVLTSALISILTVIVAFSLGLTFSFILTFFFLLTLAILAAQYRWAAFDLSTLSQGS